MDPSVPEQGEPGHGRSSSAGIPDPEQLLPASTLERLEELTNEQLRAHRAACEEAEEGVSYARRLLQGRLDLLRAELRRRDEDGIERLLDALPAILAGDDAPSDPMKARATRLRLPPSADAHAEAVDAIADEAALLRSSELPIDELHRLVDRVSEYEHELSRLRRALFDRIDALRDELARRYKDGRADVGQLLR